MMEWNLKDESTLFQNSGKSDTEEQTMWCKMHDIVHDFAQFLRKIRVEDPGMRKGSGQVCDPFLVYRAQEYRSLIWGQESFTNLCDFLCVRVLEFEREFNGSLHEVEKFIHLRWLDMTGIALSKEVMKSICKLYFLQTLLLMACPIEEIPREIGNLVQLRNLDLSWTSRLKELPESMCSLLQLQTLDIHLSDLRQLPEGIHRLENLKHLIVDDFYIQLPQAIGQLSGLRTLSEFHGGSGYNKFGLLKKLNRLTGYLNLVINVVSSTNDLEDLVKDAREAELRNKEHLQSLRIQFEDCDRDGEELSSSLLVDVIEALEPNHNLKYLEIVGYEGQRLPCWILSPLCLLRNSKLDSFSQLSSLPPMGKLPFLEDLEMRWLNELKVAGVEWLGIECSSALNVAVAFPKLKNLSFHWCRKWEEWEDITAEEEESAALHIMPSLTHLYIGSCNTLKMVPHRLLRKAKSLRVLDISNSSELLKCYQDKNGEPWRSISQFHPKLQLVTE